MNILYAWNTLNACFYGRLNWKGWQPRDIALLMIECELLLEANKLRVPYETASGH